MNYDLLVNQFMNLKKKILFVTSFNEKLYDFTGENLVKSFIFNNDDDDIDLLVCYEDFNFNIKNNRVKTENVNTNFLKKILEENKDCIPLCYGGEATIISNPELYCKDKKYNFQASRWFRKLAALEIAYSKFRNSYEYIVWIDSDCLFLSKFNSELFLKPLQNKHFGYFYGPKRLMKDHGIETGLVIFNENAFYIIKDWFSLLKNKQFKLVNRWDDGYLLKYLLIDLKYKNDNHIDFSQNLCRLNPMDYGPYTKIIKHLKGIHQNNNVVFTNKN